MNFDLLKRLCEAHAISGAEGPVRGIVAEELRPLVDSLEVDVMGNLIGVRGGDAGGPRVMVSGHLDGLGFRVRYIDDNGFLHLQSYGNWDARTMVAQRVLVHGFAGQALRGTLTTRLKPPQMQTPEEAARAPRLQDFFVDLGRTADDVRALVEIGDPVTMDRACEQVGNTVVGKHMDDRVGLFILIEVLRRLAGRPLTATVLAVATVQEEVGLRGAITAAYALNPDVGVALDVCHAVDIPGTDDAERVTRLGHGTAIKISDGALICNPKLVRHFRDIADARGIPYQLEILPAGGTEAGSVQRSRAGVAAFTLSTPTRYIHTVNEMCHTADIEAAVDLLSAYLEECHTRHYGEVL
ncbi:MAG: M42 family metallopeptidase [Capsulimonadaceae bacterium]